MRNGANRLFSAIAFPDGEKFAGIAEVTSVGDGQAHWSYKADAERPR